MSEKKDNILLFGYGRYGEKIAKYLAGDYSLYIAENDRKRLKKAKTDGYEKLFFVDIESDEELVSLLREKNFVKIFCAMDNEEENVYLAITFKALFVKIETIAICESKESERKLKLAGADKIIDTMEASANKIFHLLEKPAMFEAIEDMLYMDSDIGFYEIEIRKNSFLDGKYIKQIDLKKSFNLILVGVVDKEMGNKFVFITRGINHKLDAGDILVVIGKKNDIEKFKTELKKSAQ
ncbi:potassium channel family protein [Nitrosophilus alvini]|uniref:potassium channel family protein n=1 Tax=Nitrosophilus alvini TaxID=2714855 RepID=UPI00190B7F0D|nr:NAD-binding protein [Nitrosophilus alvini]